MSAEVDVELEQISDPLRRTRLLNLLFAEANDASDEEAVT